ncbi:MAG: hypothetical protein QMB19_09880, partial [Burkholderiaceae bacterium]
MSRYFLTRRSTLGLGVASWLSLTSLMTANIASAATGAQSWSDIEKNAKGQTVYLNAWGGGERINAYLRWVGEQVQTQYGVKLVHVKVADIAETIARVRG